MNKIEKLTLNTKIKYNEIKTLNKDNKQEFDKVRKEFAKVGAFAVSFDANNQTIAKAKKLSITSDTIASVKKLAGAILNQATAQRVQRASNNDTRKAVAFAIVKNAKAHYKTIARTQDEKLYTQQTSVAGWATLLQAYCEILTNFGTNAILQKSSGDIEILTASKLAGVVEKMNAKAQAERKAKAQARANAKIKELEQAKAKAQGGKTATKGKTKAKTSKAKAKA